MIPADQLRYLLRHADKVVPEEDLVTKLESGRPLRVKLGLDPTAPSVTLGWAVVLRKLRHFQEMGHVAVLIVGDFTARVGDPSLRSDTRKRLTAAEVDGYAENVLGQFRKVLLDDRLEIRRNSEWLGALDMGELLELTSAATVAQMLERSDFANRYQEGSPISVMEFLYPLLQGYDSVAVEADVELGGSDQLWNLMMGRVVQERYGQEPQVALTMPLLVGTDGSMKMSQSVGNYIGVEDEPGEMFGKTMSIPDAAMPEWFRLAADFDPDEVDRIQADLTSGELHPVEAKRQLARAVTTLYWGEDAARRAEEGFDLVFRHGGTPDDIEEFSLPAGDTMQMSALVRAVSGESGSEARRLLAQGAVRLDGEVVADGEIARNDLAGRVLKVGKRRFVRLAD
ncbi:MAG TPA: tyrosine--tRNA ligase [Acidimicrobiia bacterium]|nr:tyrosine--tRNA ligase [Acidimicrobiia bacterium]